MVAGMLKLPFPLLYDAQAEIFKRFGFEKRMYVVQQSGTVVIDRAGRVASVRRSANPGASLDVDELMREVAAVTRDGGVVGA